MAGGKGAEKKRPPLIDDLSRGLKKLMESYETSNKEARERMDWLKKQERLVWNELCEKQKSSVDCREEHDLYRAIAREARLQIQTGIIEKLANYTGVDQDWSKPTPQALSKLLTERLSERISPDKEGEAFGQQDWNYSVAVGMLLCLDCPTIQFAVQQLARFTHNPKRSHAKKIKWIVQYLVRTDVVQETTTNGVVK